MLQRKTVDVDGDFCVFRPMTYEVKKHISPEDKVSDPTHICPVCEEAIEDKDQIFLVLNNGKLFPNKLIHADCTADDDDSLENTAKKIRLQYRTALRYKHWFCEV